MDQFSNQQFYNKSIDQTLKDLNTTTNGLPQSEVKIRQKHYGLNQLLIKHKISALSIFIEQFKNTLTIILLLSSIIILLIYFFGEKDPTDLIEAGLIFSITLMIAFLGFIQEYKAEKAVESLKKLLAFKAKVRRDNYIQEIDVSQLVPGDIVIIEEGEKVPADIRLLNSFSLQVNESSLTGESVSINKTSEQLNQQLTINDQKNMLFSATIVTSGRGEGVVVAIGNNTQIGKIAHLVSETKDESTPIQKRLNTIGKNLTYLILTICLVIFGFILFFASDYQNLPLVSKFIHSFIASVSLAVAAIPEGLPAVVTISLALGTQRMLKKKALIRKLNSVETLGSVDTICSDKTGTLTKGEMTVKEIYYNDNLYKISGSGYETTGDFSLSDQQIDPKTTLEKILLCGLICNNASFINEQKTVGDPTEIALIISAKKANMINGLERVYEIPFNSERKIMSVIVKEKNKYYVFIKGATETILNKSSAIYLNNKSVTLNQIKKSEILKQSEKMSENALRILAFAYKEISESDYNRLLKTPQQFENDLIFLGLQGMIDPPRPEIKPLIKDCINAGIRVIMITGDHIETAKAVAKEIGLNSPAISGSQLEDLTETQLEQTLKTTNIYARINPSFKMKIIDILKKQGHIVAMTGDGVNDAPALKKADIGIAMGITGTDVSKQSSDMILLDDKFSTIVTAIEEGRGIFQNIQKFVNYLLSCNIGEVLLVFLGIVIFQDLPLTATMLLWINVVTDGLPAIALGMDQPQDNILKLQPKYFQQQIISKKLWLQMAIFGILLSISVLGIYYINLHEGPLEAKGAAFTAVIIFELVQLYIIRSAYNTKFFSNIYLYLAIFTSLSLQLLIIYNPFLSNLFEVKHIDLIDWSYIILNSIALLVILKLLQHFLKVTPKIDVSNNNLVL